MQKKATPQLTENLHSTIHISDPNPEDPTPLSLDAIPKDTLFYILDQLEKNIPFADIITDLTNRGIDEKNARNLMGQLPNFILEKKESIHTNLSVGFMLFVAGMSINILPVSYDKNRAFIIIGYFLMLAGFLKLINSLIQKNKFMKISKNLMQTSTEC